MNAYDQVLYPSHPQPQTHPDRLATIASLFGLTPAPITRCRVLELACGDGGNVIPIAWSLPGSEFVGIDLAADPIATGQEMILQLGLKNIRLLQANILDLTPGWEQFDYIIAHGLFSWIPAAVRERVLAICRGCLAPSGVAFVSYNAYPGCHLRNMVREMMLFHLRDFHDPKERIDQAMALVHFLADSHAVQDEYRQWMNAELEQILKRDRGHLYHDELAETYQPFYFTQFMAAAAQFDLQFLGEADFREMSDHPFAPMVRDKLGQLAANRLLREQYLDFLKCRRFRQTLLCRKEVSLSQTPRPEAIQKFVVSSPAVARSIPVDLRPRVSVLFETPAGAKAETDYSLGKSCLVELSEHGLAGLEFDKLAARARERLRQAGLAGHEESSSPDALAPFLLQLYNAGVVEFHTRPIGCSAVASEKPMTSPVVRWQIRRGIVVTSLCHHPIQVQDEIGRQLLLALDGTLNRAGLVQMLCNFLTSSPATKDSPPDAAKIRQTIESELPGNLAKLARMGLLVGSTQHYSENWQP